MWGSRLRRASRTFKRVGGQVEIAWPGVDTLGLRAIDPVFESDQPQRDLGRLDRHGHLVAVVLSLKHQSVDRRTDQAADHAAVLGDLLSISIR
jgi:hypothetical protein